MGGRRSDGYGVSDVWVQHIMNYVTTCYFLNIDMLMLLKPARPIRLRSDCRELRPRPVSECVLILLISGMQANTDTSLSSARTEACYTNDVNC